MSSNVEQGPNAGLLARAKEAAKNPFLLEFGKRVPNPRQAPIIGETLGLTLEERKNARAIAWLKKHQPTVLQAILSEVSEAENKKPEIKGGKIMNDRLMKDRVMRGKICGHYLFPRINTRELDWVKSTIDYRLLRGSYRHIISSGGYVFELIDGAETAKMWHITSELPRLGHFGNNEMTFYGERFRLEEITHPEISVDCGGYKKLMSYAIFVADSGKVIRVERWNGEEENRAYILRDKEIPVSAIRTKDESS